MRGGETSYRKRVRGAKALAKGDLGLNFLARGILESAFL
jgi:hypothetical protein